MSAGGCGPDPVRPGLDHGLRGAVAPDPRARVPDLLSPVRGPSHEEGHEDAPERSHRRARSRARRA